MVGGRRNIPELMDDLKVDARSLDRALAELSIINRWLGGDRVSRLGVRRILRTVPDGRTVTVLDVAAGGSDLMRALAPLGRSFEVTALDRNPRSGEFARKQGRTITQVVGSAHALPFQDRSFDIAHVSLFLHHCTDGEIRNLLHHLSRIARFGVVINDLHRHAFAYGGVSLLTRVLSRSDLVRHDAPASVLRGFLRSELLDLLPDTQQASVSRRWAFRWLATILLESSDHGPTHD
jgi:ubiquinone/menaquinone biosynthesis C-methylase UbiE